VKEIDGIAKLAKGIATVVRLEQDIDEATLTRVQEGMK
jgi:hypothetical protein